MPTPLERVGFTPEMTANITVTETDRRRMHAISPIEGRYDRRVERLHRITSEYEMHRRRLVPMVEYVIALGDELARYAGTRKKIIPRPFSDGERTALRRLYSDREDGLYSERTFQLIKTVDDKIHHDDVALVRVAAQLLSEIGFDPSRVEAGLHFARTSNDVDSSAFVSMIRDYLREMYIPDLARMDRLLIGKARQAGGGPFAAQTHGQFAVPTTFQKVYANFAAALQEAGEDFLMPDGSAYRLSIKFGGPVGNEEGLRAAYPDHTWIPFIERFVAGLGFDWARMTDQDESNVRNVKLFDAMIRVNDILGKQSSDFWDYCSRGVLLKVPKKQESGSSSMAQKVNPWRTEGGWELLEDASAQLRGFHSLMKYRRQGDLRRSRRRRLIGEPFAKITIALQDLMDDIGAYNPFPAQIQRELDEHPEMAAFYLQTVFRREGVDGAYDRIKELTMGRRVTETDLHLALDALVCEGTIEGEVGEEMKQGMKTENNTGYAKELAAEGLEQAEDFVARLQAAYQFERAKDAK